MRHVTRAPLPRAQRPRAAQSAAKAAEAAEAAADKWQKQIQANASLAGTVEYLEFDS